MATVTPNFGWDVPQSTDLVKDGATAIAALGNDIDTSLVDLKGGTTGQVLSKASNTDMDFTWVAQDDSNAIQNAIVDAKGDLITATAADTPARLAVGTNGQYLIADSTTATGLKWGDVSAGSMTVIASGSIAASSTGLDLTSIPATYKDLLLVCRGLSTNSSGEDTDLRFNNVSSNDYNTTWIAGTAITNQTATSGMRVIQNNNSAVTSGYLYCKINDYTNTTAVKSITSQGFMSTTNHTFSYSYWNNTSAVNRITMVLSGGAAFDSGTYILYGVN